MNTTYPMPERLNDVEPSPYTSYGDVRDRLHAHVHRMEGALAYGSETTLLGEFNDFLKYRWPVNNPEAASLEAQWWIEAYDSLADWEGLPGERSDDEVEAFFDAGIFSGERRPKILDELLAKRGKNDA